jgi:hypothetical protein
MKKKIKKVEKKSNFEKKIWKKRQRKVKKKWDKNHYRLLW